MTTIKNIDHKNFKKKLFTPGQPFYCTRILLLLNLVSEGMINIKDENNVMNRLKKLTGHKNISECKDLRVSL